MSNLNSDASGSFIKKRLRPEARPIDWRQLNRNQQEAFRRALYMIEEAVAGIGSNDTNRQTQQEAWLLQDNRSSNSVFISGRRGSGKSSVLLSLMKYGLRNTDATIDYESKRFKKALNVLKNRVIWLEMIDMDPLPSPFSLLPSILERISQALDRFRDMGVGHFQVSGIQNHELWHDFQQLYTDATLAWDSNIEDRQEHLDPDYYSQELQRTNNARLSLNRKFNRILGALGDQAFGRISNPLYVVTIDDFDMHPAACVNVLKMLRMLSVPRLFFVMLGDINLLEIMSDLQTSKEISEVIRRVKPEVLGVEPTRIKALSTSISRTTLRKMIPIDQRIHLEDASIVEGMTHTPPYIESERGDFLPGIASLTANLPMTIQSQYLYADSNMNVCGTPVLSLLDYLLHPGFFVFQKNEKQLKICFRDKEQTEPKNKEKKLELRLSYFRKLVDPFQRRISFALLSAFERKGFAAISNVPADIRESIPKFKGGKLSFAKTFEFSGDSKEQIEVTDLLDEDVKSFFFWGINLFKSTPRRIADLWFSFRRHVDRVTRETNRLENEHDTDAIEAVFHRLEHTFMRELGRICRDCLLEESVFEPEERSKIAAAFTPSSFGDWNWSQLPVQLLSISEPPCKFIGSDWARNRHRVPVSIEKDHAVRNLYHEIRAFAVSDWTVVGEESRDSIGDGPDIMTTRAGTKRVEKIDSSRELSSATASLLMIFHDFLRLSQKGTRFESTLIPFDDGTLEFGRRIPKLDTTKQADPSKMTNAERVGLAEDEARHFFAQDQVWCKWAATLHQASFREVQEIYWPAPGLISIWGLDMFRRCWNHTIETVNDNSRYKRANGEPASEKERVEGLAFGWIAAGCAVAAAKEPVTCRGIPESDDWEKLFVELNQLAKKYFNDERNHEESEKTKGLKYWLQNVAVMLMPETGLPSRLMFHLLFGLSVEPTSKAFFGSIKKTSDFKTQRKSYIADNIKEYLHFECQSLSEVRRRLTDLKEAYTKKSQPTPHSYNGCFDDRYWLEESGLTPYKDWEERKKAVSPQIQRLMDKIPPTDNGKTPFKDYASLREAQWEVGKWLRAFPFVRFVNEFRVDLRARRGVRLELLKNIAKRHLSERLRRSQCLHLFDNVQRQTSNLKLGGEFGELFGFTQLPRTVFTLGATFDGGGLVPHENELGYDIPDFSKPDDDDASRENRKVTFNRCMRELLEACGVTKAHLVNESNFETVRAKLKAKNKALVEARKRRSKEEFDENEKNGGGVISAYYAIRAFWAWQHYLENPTDLEGLEFEITPVGNKDEKPEVEEDSNDREAKPDVNKLEGSVVEPQVDDGDEKPKVEEEKSTKDLQAMSFQVGREIMFKYAQP